MKEDKYDKLLNAAIVLLLISASVLGYSVYKSYFKTNTSNISIAKTPAQISSIKDSLQSDYANTVSSMDTNLNAVNTNSADPLLKTKLAEMDVLKNEISTLLKSNGENDLERAKLKIEELKLRIALLEQKYSSVESENKRLQAIIDQLMAERRRNVNTKDYNTKENLTPSAEIIAQAKTILAEKIKQEKAATKTDTTPQKNSISKNTKESFGATGMRLSAMGNKNDTDFETTKSSDAEKFVGSFTIKAANPKPNDNVYIVLLQPNGKAVKSATWDGGIFDSDEGKKVYSKKIAIENTSEPQIINFTYEPDNIVKGPYTMEIWYRTNLIGRSVRTFL